VHKLLSVVRPLKVLDRISVDVAHSSVEVRKVTDEVLKEAADLVDDLAKQSQNQNLIKKSSTFVE
jgi:hypothetical protein